MSEKKQSAALHYRVISQGKISREKSERYVQEKKEIEKRGR